MAKYLIFHNALLKQNAIETGMNIEALLKQFHCLWQVSCHLNELAVQYLINLATIVIRNTLNVQCQHRTHVSRNIVGAFRPARVLIHPWQIPSYVSSLPKHPSVHYLLLVDTNIQYSPTVVIVLHCLGLFSGLLKNAIVLSLIRVFLLFN